MAHGFEDARAARAAREAAEWRTRLMEPVTQNERAEFDIWHSDPDNARAYAESTRIAALAEGLSRPVRRAHRRSHGLATLRPALAIGLTGIVLALWLTFAIVRGGDAAQAALTNPGPSTRLVRLEDGTTIALDAGTRLTLSIGNGRRAVTLVAGRARFDVAPGPTPMSVSLGAARVSADQARLDASIGKGGLAIDLLAGRARIAPSPETREILITPGEALAIVDAHVQPLSLTAEDRLWPLARIAYTGEPLAAVVARANAVGGVPIRLGPGIDALPVSGVLDLRDTKRLAPKLASALGLRLDTSNDALLLTR